MTDVRGWTDGQLFSSRRQDWATPRALFKRLDEEFEFTLDAAATRKNAQVAIFISPEEDALSSDWSKAHVGGAVWLNPPYGRDVGVWLKKAYEESKKGQTVVCLVFARTDTRWFHDFAMRAHEVRLIRGRLRFEGAENSAPAPSCLLIFRGCCPAPNSPRFVACEVPRR